MAKSGGWIKLAEAAVRLRRLLTSKPVPATLILGADGKFFLVHYGESIARTLTAEELSVVNHMLTSGELTVDLDRYCRSIPLMQYVQRDGRLHENHRGAFVSGHLLTLAPRVQ